MATTENIRETVKRMALAGLSIKEISQRLVIVKTLTERHLRSLLKDDKCTHKRS